MLSQEGSQWRVPELFRAAKIRIAPERLLKLRMFHVELLKFNPKINLVSRATASQADLLHVWDACLFSNFARKSMTAGTYYDLGSGNGIPAVICAILNEDKNWISIDTDEKKMAFLRHVRHSLALKNFKVVTGDIRLYEFDYPSFISRGFASLEKHADILEKNPSLLGKNIDCLCMKGSGIQGEIDELKKEKGSTWNTEVVGEYSIRDQSESQELKIVKLSRYS